MALDLGEELKRFVLAGIGAVAVTAEKSKEIIDDLVKKGEITVAEGKIMNEELTRKMKQKVKDVVDEAVPYKIVKKDDLTTEDILGKLEKLDEKDLNALKSKLKELELEKKRAEKTKEK